MSAEVQWPLHSLFWEATLRCNAYCEFCGSRCGGSLTSEEIDTETICASLKDISDHMASDSIMINVTGGEPLLRQDLFDVMKYAAELGFHWGMVTNGSLIREDTVQKMKNTGMRTISISLDGLPETHNRLRKIPDGFQRVNAAVALLSKADFLDEIQITTVVNHENIGELESLMEILLTWGIDSWRLAIMDPIGRAEDNQRLFLTQQDYQTYFHFLDQHQFNGKIALTTSCSHYLDARDNLYRTHRFSCQTGKTVGSILANGDIYVCPNVPRVPNLIQGNIQRDSFSEVWKNGFQWFRDKNRQKSEKCEDCEKWHLCQGDSLHTWDFITSVPKFCYKEKCELEPETGNFEETVKKKLLSYSRHIKGYKVSFDSSSNKKVLFTPQATRMLLAFFDWGECSPRNAYELLAGLAGYGMGDLAVVECVIPGELEERSLAQASFSERNYLQLLRELNTINSSLPESEEKYHLWGGQYCFLGIAHSHPGDLAPTMSMPDMELHDSMKKAHDIFLSVILNPQKKSLCVFWDSVYSPVDVEFLFSPEQFL